MLITAKIHPHRTKVVSGEEKCVSITPVGGHAYYKGCVMLHNAHFVIHDSGLRRAQREQVRNVHAWCAGELAWAIDNQHSDAKMQKFVDAGYVKVTYHYNIGRFVTMDGLDVTARPLRAAVCNGRDFFVLLDNTDEY